MKRAPTLARLTYFSPQNFNNITILDALGYCGVSVGMFPAGYAAAASDSAPTKPFFSTAVSVFYVSHSHPIVAPVPGNPCYPLGFDATDVGFSYAASIADRPDVYADSQSLVARIQLGTLPSVSYVRSLGTASEHPVRFYLYLKFCPFPHIMCLVCRASPRTPSRSRRRTSARSSPRCWRRPSTPKTRSS